MMYTNIVIAIFIAAVIIFGRFIYYSILNSEITKEGYSKIQTLKIISNGALNSIISDRMEKGYLTLSDYNVIENEYSNLIKENLKSRL